MRPEQLIIEGLAALSPGYSKRQVNAFLTYLAELKKWSRAYNLTGLRTDREIIIKHFLDSLFYLEGVPQGAVSLIDVGSGAGFPGIPVKIMRPEIALTLLEPSRKKASFLLQMKRLLRLEKTAILEKRIEDIGPAIFDVAVTRALFDIKSFIQKASPLVKSGGRIILNKGPKVAEEMAQFNMFPGDSVTISQQTLPFTGNTRFIVIIEKAADIPEETTIVPSAKKSPAPHPVNTCFNTECRLRKAGCSGFAGCPGFRTKDL